MIPNSDVSRRTLLKVMGGVGASFALGCYSMPAKVLAGTSKRNAVVFAPSAFVKIDPSGLVHVTISKSDMGQGIRTTLAMIVAEELDADWANVRVEQAIADPKYGGQGTGGSSSTSGMYNRLREVGAGARHMLVAAAAQKWGVDPATCTTLMGKVLHAASGKSIGYGELTEIASTITPPTEVVKKDRANFKIIGKSKPRIDNKDVVRGKAIYGIDAKVEGMAYAMIARKPSFGATLKSVDDAAARKVAGVIDVVTTPNGPAVVAKNTWAAMKGRDALKVEWDLGPNADLDSKAIHAKMVSVVGEHKPTPAGAKVVNATYEMPFLAHAPMEPMNALADVRDGKCTVWAPTQSPDGAKSQVARVLGIPASEISINVTLLGGGFGRRLSNDYIEEAVLISKATKRPIKVLWSREDDMTHDNYRPASYHSMRGAVDAEGKPVTWSHWTVLSGGRGRGGAALVEFSPARIAYNIEDAGRVDSSAGIPVPTGAWRSVESGWANVAHECFIDELATAAGKDPFEFRRGLLKNERQRKVLELVAEKAGWGKPLPAGHGRGIACFSGFGSFAAHVVELSIVKGQVKIHRVVCAVDCGLAINPKGVEAQAQGACVDALTTTLKAAITINKGGAVESNFSDFEWTRMDEMPKIEVHITDSPHEPSGMGEPGYPSVPPAIANAVFAVTGKRVRKFPIKLSELA